MSRNLNDGVFHIKVTNKIDNSVWEHRRVPREHVEMLKLSPNLKVEVLRVTGLYNAKKNSYSSR